MGGDLKMKAGKKVGFIGLAISVLGTAIIGLSDIIEKDEKRKEDDAWKEEMTARVNELEKIETSYEEKD